MRDPFSQVYDALFGLVANDPRITALVRPGNLITYGQLRNANPDKENYSVADLPTLHLISSTASVNLFDTSSTSKVIKRYSWVGATGDFRIHSLHSVEFALLCALANWKKYLGLLRWPETADKSFVKALRTGDFATTLGDGERGIRGWSTVLNIEIELHFTTQHLIELG